MSGEFWFLSDSAIRALAQGRGEPPGALPGGPGLCVLLGPGGGSGEWRPRDSIPGT